MTTLSKVGSFNLRTGTGTQSITGLGFQPKLIIFWSQVYCTVDPIPVDNNSNPGKQLLRFFGAASATASSPIENLLTYSEQFDNAAWTKGAATVTSTAPASGTQVVPNFWGMHTTASTLEPWPSVSFSTQRLWDSYPGVSWTDINTSNGTYNWTNLDNHLSVSSSHSITELIYTFGYVPSWVNGSQTNNPTDTAWSNFVTAIVNRYKTTIKYWELWNEPNSSTFWTGSTAQMVHLASIAAPIIRGAGCYVLSPCPQGANAHLWLQDFFNNGGGSYVDIIAFHSYTYDAPETLLTNYANLKTVLNNAGQGSKEVWDTEHSWGDSSWPFGGSDTLKEAYLARLIALSIPLGIKRSAWYSYDNTQWGTLADKTTDTLLPPGVAYNTLYGWLNNRYVSTQTVSGTVYSMQVMDNSGFNGYLVWDTSGNSSYSTPAGMSRYGTLDGVNTSTTPGSSVTIGVKPILFDNVGSGSPNIVSPTGTAAMKLIPDTSSTAHYVSQNTTYVGIGTFSLYAKAGEWTYISLANGDSNSNWVHFDLIGNGAYYLGNGWSAASIAPVGNGWYRCSATSSASVTWSAVYITARSVQDTNGNARTLTAGNGTSGLYIWGAQLNSGTQLLNYTKTTTTKQQLTNTTSNISRWCAFSGVNYHINGAENTIQGNKCILWVNPFDGAQYMDADFTSVDSDGFTINVTTAIPSNITSQATVQVNYLALGGSSITAKAGTFNANTGDYGTTQTYSVGFQPKAMIFATGPQADGTTPDTGGSLGLGFAIGSSASSQMGCTYWESPESSRLTKNVEYQGGAILKIGYNGDYLDTVGIVSSFSSTGFSIFYKNKNSSTTCITGYIALGGTAAYSLGVITEPGSTGLQTIQTPGVKPVAQLFMTSGNNSSGTTIESNVTFGFGTLNSNSNMTVGGSDAHGQFSISHYVPDGNTDDTTIVGIQSSTAGLGNCSPSATFRSLSTFKTDFSQSFTINWTTVSGTSIRYPYLVIGDTPMKSSRSMISIF